MMAGGLLIGDKYFPAMMQQNCQSLQTSASAPAGRDSVEFQLACRGGYKKGRE